MSDTTKEDPAKTLDLSRLSSLEKLLFDREFAILRKELNSALCGVYKVFEKYSTKGKGIAFTKTGDAYLLDEWIKSQSVVSGDYYAGYHLDPATANISPPPGFLSRIMLDYVVGNFIGRLDAAEAGLAECSNLASEAMHHAAMNQ